MNILNRLAKKNLKLNKKRTVVTIIGIILATALITGVATVAASFQASRLEHQKETEGNFHYEFKGIPKNQIEEISSNDNIEGSFITKDLGVAEYTIANNNDSDSNENIDQNLDEEDVESDNFDTNSNSCKIKLEVTELSEDAFNNLGINVVAGRLPENSKEIVISSSLDKYDDENLKVGNNVSLNIGDGKNTQEGKYEIVGKVDVTSISIEMPGFGDNSTYAVLSKMDDQSSNQSKYNVYVRFKDLNTRLNTAGSILGLSQENIDNYKSIKNIVKAEDKLLDDQTKKYDIYINNGLIQLEGGGYRDATEDMIYYIAFLIIVVIVIISVYCIKNSFNISMTERIKEYGMLTSIGATKKQIKKEMLHEAYFIGLIAIPIGLILGIAGIYLILQIIQNFLSDELFGMKFVFSVSFVSIIMAVALSIATIYFSAVGAARKASRISPIEAIKENKDIQINKKNIKPSKTIKKLFGVGGDIAYKNLKRNKKKYRTTVVSITLSVSVFIAVISFMSYADKANEILFGDVNYNVQVYGRDYKGLTKIAKDSQITTYSLLGIKDADVMNYEGHTTREAQLQGTNYPVPENINIVSLGEQEYERYIQKLGLKYDDVKDKAILYDYKTRTVEVDGKDRYLVYRIYDFKEGDTIKCSVSTDEYTKNFSIEIAKVANEEPMYLLDSNMPYLIVSDEYWKNVPESYFGIDGILSIVTDNAEEMTEYIKNNYNGSYDSIVNIDESEKEQKAQTITIVIFVYIFIGVTTLIGITNIFNTITTSMELRQQEFANLKAIGMTKKEFNRMIRLETIFYCMKSLIIGIPLGLLLSYAIYKGFEINFIGLKFIWPIPAILISILAVLILIGAIMKYSLNKINKQNIIETIRKENI